jgi:N-acyl-D-aspartate/D-glutamate deacylase
MAGLVREAMAAGAIGFATSTADQHNGENGIPMPSRLADEAELRALVGAMGDSGRGIFMLTKGNRTTESFLESLAADTGRPVMIAALLHNSTNPEAGFAELRNIAAACERGHELYGQVTCCPLSTEFTMASPYPFEGLKAWKPVITASDAETVKRVYANPAFRQSLRDELTTPAAVRLFNGEYDKLLVTEVADPANRDKEGQSVAVLAAADGKDPLDWLFDFAVAEDLATLFTAVLLNSDEEEVGRLLRDPNSAIALSDAGAHLTLFCDAGFGLHLLGRWHRDLGQFTLAQAVHELTGRTAAIFRIPDRGRIALGNWADLMLFDPATVGRGSKQRLHDLPGGAPRLVTPAVGLHGVWVNGQRVADANGIVEDAGGSGRLLREFAV